MGLWLVIDLEATTEDGGWPVSDMEIIEIGASLADGEGHEVAHFQRLIKPQRRPLLTEFCRELTNIDQSDIDDASALSDVWADFEDWLQPYEQRYAGWVSWGDFDRRLFISEWKRHGIASTLSALPHVNLKQRFARANRLEKPVGLNKALNIVGLEFRGEQHRALTDARNTARLIPHGLAG